MRLALISDLHGNLLAVEAVLADARRLGADRIVCLGDVSTLGPRPREVLALLRDLGCECIQGNHDEYLLDAEAIHRYQGGVPPVVRAVDWCRAEMTAEDLDFVRGFRAGLDVPLAQGRTAVLFHGSPRSNSEDLVATTPEPALDEALAGRSGTVMAGGHTHVQMIRQHRGSLLVNPGSVGLPFRDLREGGEPVVLAQAEYALVDDDAGVAVTLRRVPLDRAALRAEADAAAEPVRALLARQYLG